MPPLPSLTTTMPAAVRAPVTLDSVISCGFPCASLDPLERDRRDASTLREHDLVPSQEGTGGAQLVGAHEPAGNTQSIFCLGSRIVSRTTRGRPQRGEVLGDDGGGISVGHVVLVGTARGEHTRE